MINVEKLIIVDIETLKNCFILCARDYKTGAKKQYTLYQDEQYANEAQQLYVFLKNCVRNGYAFVTFNGLGFDMQVLHYFYDWCSDKQDPLYQFENQFIIEKLYEKAQSIITIQDNDDKFKYLIQEKDLFMPTIDLFKQLHYDRPAKRTSLKWVEFSMCYPTIQDMPIAHDEDINKDDVETVLEYCWNDVDATYEFFNKVKFETDLRLQLSENYKLNLINASEPKIARDIFGKILSKEMEISYMDLKKLKTIRKEVKFKNIIFPYIKFITPELKKLLDDFNEVVIDCNPHSKQSFKYDINYNNLPIDLGLGGIHGCTKSGIYTPKEDEEIIDFDVTSMYPQIAIQNGLKPEHLGDAFSKVYSEMFLERKKYDKKDPRNYVIKIILNSTYGLSSEINGYFYDKKYTYATTINGQLMLLMFAEAVSLSIPDVKLLQMNTDGITFIYKTKYKDKLEKILQWWENNTKLTLEQVYYSKMVIMDVNNYFAIYTDGKVKKKGLFETEMPYHKNPSALIIPKALEQYFMNNANIDEYIKNPDNAIYDYCLGVKKKTNFKLNLIQNFNFAELIQEQQKVCRYYISEKSDTSGLLVKDFTDGRRVSVEANIQVETLYVVKPERKEVKYYNINYQYYIKECNKIINEISPFVTQQTLF